MAERVCISAPAKVNLRLKVLAREASGYHALETVFCAVSLMDDLEAVATRRPGISLAPDTSDSLGPPEDNLVVRAAQAFFDAIGRTPAVQFRLTKRVPVAVGLGGGSSDAAAALRALSYLYGHPLSHHDLLQLGSGLGADVPFFLGDSPLALAWGRGERLLSLPPLPRRSVLIAHPGVPIPTPLAFRRLSEDRGPEYRSPSAQIPVESLHSWRAVAEVAENDFHPLAVEMVPQVACAVRILGECGAMPALLSGSGAAVFGVFQDAPSVRTAANRLSALGFRTWAAQSLARFPAPRVDPRQGQG